MYKKGHVLYIGNKLALKGNTVSSIETLGTFLDTEGYTVVMASSKKNKVLRLLDMLWTTIQQRKKVTTVLIDTYSTQNFHFAVWVARICRIYKMPYIPILRGGDLPNRLQKSKKLCDELFYNAKTNVAPSQFLKEDFIKAGYTNITYIPNTIKLENYEFKKRYNLKPRLLWVRSFAEIYNPQLALKVVASLLKKGIKIELCMVGPEKDGALAICKTIVANENLPVKFTGKLSKLEWITLAKEYDIFINTTNFDNTPVSVIEAMAIGLPVVSTNVGGMPFLIENSSDGILVKPNAVKEMEEAILSLIENPELVKKLTISAREKVSKFDWTVVKEQWFKLLDN